MTDLLLGTLLGASITALPATANFITSLFHGKILHEIRVEINGRLTQLMAVAKAASLAEGKALGKEEGLAVGKAEGIALEAARQSDPNPKPAARMGWRWGARPPRRASAGETKPETKAEAKPESSSD